MDFYYFAEICTRKDFCYFWLTVLFLVFLTRFLFLSYVVSATYKVQNLACFFSSLFLFRGNCEINCFGCISESYQAEKIDIQKRNRSITNVSFEKEPKALQGSNGLVILMMSLHFNTNIFYEKHCYRKYATKVIQ